MSGVVVPPAGTWTQRVRYRAYGMIFLVVVALLVALTIALYDRAFRPAVDITLNSGRAGLQLLPHSDVKIRGLIVGEVDDIRVTPTGAAIDLAIQPDKVPLIPGDVSARLLPKTVFGEKYVDLVPPERSQRARPIREGDVISQDRSTIAVEVEKVLNDLMPLLRALQPEKINATLNALATALQGRGNQIGELIETSDAYLRKINTQLPVIAHDIRALGDVAETFDQAAPDLLRIFRNLSVTNQTIVDKRAGLAQVLQQGIDISDRSREFLRDNESRIVGFQIANRDALALLARYSPSFPCVVEGVSRLQPRLEESFGGGQPGLHITLELVKPRPGYKQGLDNPEYGDHRGPRCYGLPDPKVPFPQFQLLDGTEDDKWWAGRSTSGIFIDSASAGDEELINGMLASMLRTPVDQVPDFAALLFAPMASGSVVQIR